MVGVSLAAEIETIGGINKMPENTIIINRSIQNLIDNKLLPENREAAVSHHIAKARGL